jgi:peroxiredoxin
MAKFPKTGSRRGVASHVLKKLQHEGFDNLMAIQPQILVSFDDMFYWSVKIISVHKDTSGVGIQRKYEEGFEIVEDDNGKFTSKLRVMKSTSGKLTKKSSKRLPMIAKGKSQIGRKG